MSKIEFERTYPYAIEMVWRALTESDAIAAWLMANDFQPVVGHRFQFQAKPMPGWNGLIDCEVTAVEPPHKLAYTWNSMGLRAVVTWVLEPVAEGTKLLMIHEGFEGPQGEKAREALGRGWNQILSDRLPAVVARLAAGETISPKPPQDCH
jgi:uncharacterized protein YndB with AHSA1/START domain